MADGKIDYGKLANKLAGDAGRVTRKGIDFLVGVVKPENIRKVTDGVRSLAGSAVEGWKAAGEDNETETTKLVDEPESIVEEPTDDKTDEKPDTKEYFDETINDLLADEKPDTKE